MGLMGLGQPAPNKRTPKQGDYPASVFFVSTILMLFPDGYGM